MSILNKKNIIVTGATGGIGNSIVKKLSEAGANIIATGTKVNKLEEIKKKFSNLRILPFDISQNDKVENFIEQASKELGGNLDCIINNAGITNDNLAIRMTLEEWKKLLMMLRRMILSPMAKILLRIQKNYFTIWLKKEHLALH